MEYPDLGEACVYCLGALKFLSGNTTIAKSLSQMSLIQALAKLLASVNEVSNLQDYDAVTETRC